MRIGSNTLQSVTCSDRSESATARAFPMPKPLHVSLVAIPEASISTLHGLFDVLSGFDLLRGLDDSLPEDPPFQVEIVGAEGGSLRLASGLTAQIHRSVTEVPHSDIVIVPSVVLGADGWQPGRSPKLVSWLKAVHEQGALLCSACSGVFLVAETGLYQNQTITLHWTYVNQFRELFPDVVLHPEQALIVAGDREQLVTSGASMSWHDLVLYLIARFVGRTGAQTIANFFALQWHPDGLGPYIVFDAPKGHGDAAIRTAQEWLSTNYAIADPISEIVALSALAERTFMRRFQEATGHTPLTYVQRLRIEEAKRRLERTDQSIETIGWHVGYEDPAFFRRLFKRITGVTPGHYRKRFRLPEHAS